MRFLSLDTETTGLDPKRDRIIEVGWALADDQHGILLTGGGLIKAVPGESLLTDEIIRLTGITDAQRIEFGRPLIDVLGEAAAVVEKHEVEHLVGHNLEFDRGFINPAVANFLLGHCSRLTTLPGIDTKTDLPLDYEPENTSLKSMLADHRMINVVPHRALFDAVMTAMLVLEYPYDAVLRRASSPTLLLHADVPFALNALPKALRFQWEPDTKRWLRKTRECDLDKVTGAWKKTKERLATETGNQAFASAALRKVPA